MARGKDGIKDIFPHLNVMIGINEIISIFLDPNLYILVEKLHFQDKWVYIRAGK